MLFNSKKSGFKLLSLLFVVGLTFAACSQDYDDQISDVTDQIAEEVTARSEAVAKLESQLKSLQDAHDADIKKLQEADAKLSQAVADAEKAAKDYADKVAAAEADAAEAAAKAYADAQDKVILATAEAAAAEAEANAKAYTEAQIAALKAQLENEIAAAKKELTEKYDAEIAALKTKDAELQKAIDDAKAKAEKDLADAVAKIEAAHKADIDRIDAAVAAIDARVKDIEAWEATAKTQIAANETAIAALKGDLAKEIADREAADKALQTALNTLGSKVDANYNELNGKIQANYEELKKADDALYAAIVDNAKKIKDLQDADVALGKRIDGVVADLDQAKKDIEKQIKDICGDIDDLYSKYDALNKDYTQFKKDQAKKDSDQDTALADAKKELQDSIDAAVAKAENELAAAKQELQDAIEKLDSKLSAAIKVLSERPTTIIFKPYLFIGGIETFEFNPMYYYAYENADNKETTYVDGLVPTNFCAPTYVALPKEIEYEVNPWSTTIDYLDIYNTKFNFHVAEVRPEYGTRGDEAPYLSVNKAENYTPSIKNHILKFRVDESVVDGAAAWTKALDFGKVVMFAAEIPFAGEDTTVVSDYARLSECPFTAFFRVADADDKVYPLYNDSKKAIYAVTVEDRPVNIKPNDKFIYQIEGFEVDGENPTLLSLVNNAEFDAMKEPFVVDALRAEDLGFEYRFYVPREDEVEVNKSADVDEVFYKGPQYGPWGYAAAGTDFQKLIKSIDHKTGAVEFAEKAKGLTPIVLIQLVDPKHDYQVVTESYVRLVVEGDQAKDAADVVTTYPNCDDEFIDIVYTAEQMKDLVYDKFGVDQAQFENHWDKDTLCSWSVDPAPYKDAKALVGFDANGNLVAKVPYSALNGLTSTGLKDFTVTYVAKLGGNSVEITFTAKVGLPSIELAYMNTYWKSMPKAAEHVAGVIVGNPRPISEENYTAYASYDFDLRDGYNTKKDVTGFVYDGKTGLQYKATFNGENISEDYKDCIELDLFAIDFTTASSASKFVYDDGVDSILYADLSKKYNEGITNFDPANYVEAVQQNKGVQVSPFNVQLVEKDNAPAINTPWGSQAAIDMLDADAKVPAVVVCRYKFNDTYAERVVDEFMIDYEKPIHSGINQREDAIIDALHKVQSISYNDLIKLTDWLGFEVAAYAVTTVPSKGDSSAKALAHYYNVADPEWRVYETVNGCALTDLKVGEDGVLKADPALVEQFINQGVTDKNEKDYGPLPDGISLIQIPDSKVFNYNNVGGLVKEDYHMFLEATLKHKWGEVPAKVIITVKANPDLD